MTQGRIRHWAAVATAPPAIDDLAVLLPDWRTHLRSRNVAPSTIASYLKVGDNLLVWLREAGMPTSAAGIAREHLEAFLAALSDRVSPATVAKHYRSLQQLFRWLVEDGEVGHSPMARMRPPAVPAPPPGNPSGPRPCPSSRSTSSPTTNSAPSSTPLAATPSRTAGTPPCSA